VPTQARGNALNELALAIRTPQGMAVVVGCAHPGVENALAATARIDPALYTVTGGFHLVQTELAGIQIERIQPGHPQQNGRHERMHLTLKREATKPAAANVLQQQARFDDFLTRFNTDRPHQALGMKVPADLYARSPRVYRGLEELTYPFHDQTILVTRCGRICFKGRKVNLSHVFAGQSVG
jgi:hypothetical protein